MSFGARVKMRLPRIAVRNINGMETSLTPGTREDMTTENSPRGMNERDALSLALLPRPKRRAAM